MNWSCEHKPYEGAGYWCYLDRGHDGFHSDLTLLWDDNGTCPESCTIIAATFVNQDGTRI